MMSWLLYTSATFKMCYKHFHSAKLLYSSYLSQISALNIRCAIARARARHKSSRHEINHMRETALT